MALYKKYKKTAMVKLEELAKSYYSKGDLSLAFEAFCEYLTQLNAETSAENEQIFTKIANKLASICEQVNQDEQAIEIYRKALNFFPNNVYVLNTIGSFMYRLGEIEHAYYYLKKASEDNYYLPAHKNLLHVTWQQLPRWHFRMMNDWRRNESYKIAIIRAIEKGYKNVYDIGAGCGLLSMIAATNGASTVAALEESSVLYNLTKEIIKFNEIPTHIQLFNDNSKNFSQPIELCNLIVTEIFDCGLFGEHAIDTLLHAITVFPTQQHFQTIPASANCFIMGLESRKLNQKFRLCRNVPELNLNCSKICLKILDTELYDSADIYYLLKQKQAKIVTDTKMFLHINFSDKQQLKMLKSNNFPIIELIATENCSIDVLVFYFELFLDEFTKITTNPLDENRCPCWENAIFYLEHSIKLEKHQKILIKSSLINNQLKFSLIEPIYNCNTCLSVSKEIITHLNDDDLCRTIQKGVDSLDLCNTRILDVNLMPFFGLLAAKRGASVYAFQNECDYDFFTYLTKLNNFPNLQLLERRISQSYSEFLPKVDYFIDDLIDIDGSWKGTQIDDNFKEQNIKIFPNKVILHCQLIYSDYLSFSNKLNDTNMCNFKFSQFLEQFRGDEHPNIENIDGLQCKTEQIQFDISDNDKFNFDGIVNVLFDGNVNGILYWFSVFFGNECYTNDLNNDQHYSIAVKLLPNDIQLTKGNKVEIHVEKLFDHLRIACKVQET